jgi:uncharacterized membrane protein
MMGAGLLLRLFQIGSEGLWIDEAFSIWLARHPLGEMVHWVRTVDHHPPLYYVLLRGWLRIVGLARHGTWLEAVTWPTASSRALSAVFGVLNLPVVYGLGRRLADEQVGLLATLILTLSPFHVRFAQETRMYTLLTLNVSLALYAFVELYDRRMTGAASSQNHLRDAACRSDVSRQVQNSPWPWVCYVIFTSATLWTHNTAIFFPLAVNLLVGGRILARHWFRSSAADVLWLRRWLIAQVAVLLLWSPWLPSLLSQASDVYRRFWLPEPTLGTVVSIIGAFLCDSSPLPFLSTVLLDAGLAVLALLGLGKLRRRSASAALLGVVFLTPFVGQWFVSLWRPILYARTLIWASIPLYLMMAAGVAWLSIDSPLETVSQAATLVVVTAVVVTSGAALCNYYATFEKEAWDEAAALVAGRIEPGDLLLFNAAWGQIPFDYYFDQMYNRSSEPVVVEHGLPVDLFDRGVLEPKMEEEDLPRLRRLVAGRRRVWLVYSHQWYTDPAGLIPSALAKLLDLEQQWTFDGLQVRLYVEE